MLGECTPSRNVVNGARPSYERHPSRLGNCSCEPVTVAPRQTYGVKRDCAVMERENHHILTCVEHVPYQLKWVVHRGTMQISTYKSTVS